MKNLKTTMVSRSIVHPLQSDGYPLKSDIFYLVKLDDGLQYYEIDEDKLLSKLEDLLYILEATL